MKRRITRTKALELERLELRTLLTGNVDAFVNDDGDFVAFGDDADNTVWIRQHDGEEGVVSIWGDDETTINGQSYNIDNPLRISGLTRDVNVNLNRGDDILYSYGMHAPRDLRVAERTGNDEIHVYLGSVGRMLDISAGVGDDAAYVDEVAVDQGLLLAGGPGRDNIHVVRSEASVMTINAGDDNDRVFVRDVDVAMEGLISGGSGENDRLQFGEEAYQAGDGNVDGQFDQRDIVLALQGGKYLTGEPASFEEGDWNYDGVFDQLDIVAALETGEYLQGPYLAMGVSEIEELGQARTGGVMDLKIDDANFVLIRQTFGPEMQMQAAKTLVEALSLSNIIVLPTQGDPEGEGEFEEHMARFNRAIQALETNVRLGLGNDESQNHNRDIQNFLKVLQEALNEVAHHTRQCDPAAPQQCVLLNQNDEGGTVVDDILAGIFSRQLRSPFPLIFTAGSLRPNEQVITTGPLADGECAGIVKEIQGVKVVLTPRVINVWQEPWFARRRIIGTTIVWVWEFVPAEFIKTISVCNPIGAGNLETTVESLVVHDRALLHFWRFLDKDVTPVPGH